MFCGIKDGGGCRTANGTQPAAPGLEYTFAPARVPLWGETNVGFSQTFANLLLATLPADAGVIILNTGVGGTGFFDHRWGVPNGTHPGADLTWQSVNSMKQLAASQPAGLPGKYIFHAMLWHQVRYTLGEKILFILQTGNKIFFIRNQSLS